ncbi:MAG: multiheme c-type cytochrome [Bryobacteraceae bacterium]
MKDFLRSIEHLIRVVVILAVGVAAFLLIRRAVIPANFGEYGHFRPAAMDDIRARPVKVAGHAVCEACHSDVAELKSKGKHAGVSCEACHGPLANHAEDPGSVIPKLPDAAVLCVRCHEANASKPKSFPQVVSAEHSGGLVCTTCHQQHDPLNAGGGKP